MQIVAKAEIARLEAGLDALARAVESAAQRMEAQDRALRELVQRLHDDAWRAAQLRHEYLVRILVGFGGDHGDLTPAEQEISDLSIVARLGRIESQLGMGAGGLRDSLLGEAEAAAERRRQLVVEAIEDARNAVVELVTSGRDDVLDRIRESHQDAWSAADERSRRLEALLAPPTSPASANDD